MKANNLPFISFVIPTYNNDDSIKNCLVSIREQRYPQNKIEILIADGGSRDKTLQIAEQYDCHIIHNPKRLAEPGVDLGLTKAKGEICTILAADNVLQGRDWIKKMIKPFKDPLVEAAFPIHLNTKDDTWLTKYINTFTDPFNHFVYGSAANMRTFHKVFKTLEKTKDYVIYDYTLKNHPILAFAQGFTVRKGFKRSKEGKFCDLLPVLQIIKEGRKIAYVPTAGLYHHTMKELKHFLKKQRWAAANALLKKPYGWSGREKYLSRKRMIRKYFWPIYCLTLIGPLMSTIRGIIFGKEPAWFYHLPISLVACLAVLAELIRIKLLGQTSALARK